MTSAMLALCWVGNGRPETVSAAPGYPLTQAGFSLWVLVALGTSLGGGVLLESRVREPVTGRRPAGPGTAPGTTAGGLDPAGLDPAGGLEAAAPRRSSDTARELADLVDPPARMRTPSEAWQAMHAELVEVITALRLAEPAVAPGATGATGGAGGAGGAGRSVAPAGTGAGSRAYGRWAAGEVRAGEPGDRTRLRDRTRPPGAGCPGCGSTEVDVIAAGGPAGWSARFQCRECRRGWPQPRPARP